MPNLRMLRWTLVAVLLCAQPIAHGRTLRYSITVGAFNVTFGSSIANCTSRACSVTITGVGEGTNAVPFPIECTNGPPPCGLKGTGGGGVWNKKLRDVAVSVYDPTAQVTYGPGSLPSGYFVSFDNFNGGIGFGSDGPGGPAYPISLVFPGGMSAYQYGSVSIHYGLDTPILLGGILDNCPVPGPCAANPPPEIPVLLSDGRTVPFYFRISTAHTGSVQFWVQDEPATIAWRPASRMKLARVGHTATTLADGNVLVVGGAGDANAPTTAEIYNSATDSWKWAASPHCPRTGHSAVLMADGRVLVIGGATCPQSAEMYDPKANVWNSVAQPGIARSVSVAVRLLDGRALVAGGALAEIYDPKAAGWTPTASFAATSEIAAAMLPSGKVVVIGSGGALQIFDPASNRWTAGASPHSPGVSKIDLFALPNGTALATGLGGFDFPQAWWELYDPQANGWGLPTYNGFLDRGPNAWTLPFGGQFVGRSLQGGQVLLTGGIANIGGRGGGTRSAQTGALYDPGSQTWRPVGALASGRIGHALVELPDGKILAIGGTSTESARTVLSSVERLDSRPTALMAPTNLRINLNERPAPAAIEQTNLGVTMSGER